MNTIEAYGKHYDEVPAIIDQTRVTPEYYDRMVGSSALGQTQFALELSEFRGSGMFIPREVLPPILPPRTAFSENLEGYGAAHYISDADMQTEKSVLGGSLFSVMPGIAKELTVIEDVLLLPRFVTSRFRVKERFPVKEISIHVVRDPRVRELGWPRES